MSSLASQPSSIGRSVEQTDQFSTDAAPSSRGGDGSKSEADTHSDTYTVSSIAHDHQSTLTTPLTSDLTVIKSGKIKDSEDERRGSLVQELARQITQQPASWTTLHNPFLAQPGSILDPHSDNFNPKVWSKAMLQLHNQDEKAHPLRTSGFAFRNLNVHGFGTATDYQKTVGNVVLQGIGAVRRKIMGVGQHKISILQDMDGLVKSGELLVVLGPPGSGCSTFLKTIAGETSGLVVEEGSDLNYQGETELKFLSSL
jgi:ATP-binding cassette subfamily G (WHITE) protein 2 (PDR)